MLTSQLGDVVRWECRRVCKRFIERVDECGNRLGEIRRKVSFAQSQDGMLRAAVLGNPLRVRRLVRFLAIEANRELTIRSVVNNRMLYQEGWGVESIKHSLTYSGGYSRGCVRSYACARQLGFNGFSPYTRPSVIAVAEAIPFAELTQGSHERLYALKGDIVSRGVQSVLGLEMPVFPKRRFQHGSAAADQVARLFPQNETHYRHHFETLHSPVA